MLHLLIPKLGCEVKTSKSFFFGRILSLVLGTFLLLPRIVWSEDHPPRYITPNPVGTVVFSVGDAQVLRGSVTSELLERGSKVRVGDVVLTGPSSHVHLKMVDEAFVSIRPESRLRITEYRYDPFDTTGNQVKFELEEGIARSVTGKAGELNKSQYRLNTPVAAIGVRGTDFTVYTTDDITRVAVRKGGVVVSPFVAGCLAQGVGPCEGSTALELSAADSMKMLEVTRDSITQRAAGESNTPDEIVPPLPEEIDFSGDSESEGRVSQTPDTDQSQEVANSPAEVINPVTNDLDRYLDTRALLREAYDIGSTAGQNLPNDAGLVADHTFVWGRWLHMASDDPTYQSIGRLINAGNWYRSLNNSVFVLLEDNENRNQPVQGTGKVSFKLNAYETYIRRVNELEEAWVSNPALLVDFDTANFATRLDVSSESIADPISVLGHGSMSELGTLRSDPDSPSFIEGAVSADGTQAGYIFETQLTPGVEALGATTWVR